MTINVIDWLRKACSEYHAEPIAIYRAKEDGHWPLVAGNEAQLREKLEASGHFIALPKEPAALANVLEVSIADFLISRLADVPGATSLRGTERGYPDIEVAGAAFGGFHAIDIKVARRMPTRRRPPRRTNSRITLYTGNTYFRHPELRWPGMFRPFQDYASHVDVIVIYTLNAQSLSRITDLEFIVQEPWRIASRHRSSSTREYIGAVDDLQKLRAGNGDFETPEEFYRFWRKHNFKMVNDRQLKKLLRDQSGVGASPAKRRRKG